jgi:hypothetical protein
MYFWVIFYAEFWENSLPENFLPKLEIQKTDFWITGRYSTYFVSCEQGDQMSLGKTGPICCPINNVSKFIHNWYRGKE